VIDINPSDIA